MKQLNFLLKHSIFNLRFCVLLVILFGLGACVKSPHDIFSKDDTPGFNGGGVKDNGRPTSSFKVFAVVPDFNNSSPKVTENEQRINLPTGRNIVLTVDTFFNKVENVSWKLNGKSLAQGNNATVTLGDIGIQTLSVDFSEVGNGKKHSKQLKLYAFRQMLLSIVISPKNNICGKVAIGVGQTLGSFGNERIDQSYIASSVQDVCVGKTNDRARIARVPISIFDKNTSFSIDLIEPKEIKEDNSIKFCLLFFCTKIGGTSTNVTPLQVYQTDVFSATLINNNAPGTYTSGGTTITLENK